MSLTSDPATAAGLVVRDVRTGTRDGAPTRVVVARRELSTDRDDLWDALTNPERIPRWFLPVSGDLSVGGRYQTEGNAGGVVEECERPERFRVTWEMGPTVSWLTVSLSPAGSGTALELVHEAPFDPEFWTQFGPGAVGVGWDLALLGLALHLSSGEPVDPQVGLSFTFTPDGKAFVRAAATDWADAAVRNGDDAKEAQAAAEATTGFYTTMPEETAQS